MIANFLEAALELTAGQVTGSLDKLRLYKFPFISRPEEREPRPKAGSAYRYDLTWRGLAYAYLRWPELKTNDDAWKAD